jgi:hypothetical protein
MRQLRINLSQVQRKNSKKYRVKNDLVVKYLYHFIKIIFNFRKVFYLNIIYQILNNLLIKYQTPNIFPHVLILILKLY